MSTPKHSKFVPGLDGEPTPPVSESAASYSAPDEPTPVSTPNPPPQNEVSATETSAQQKTLNDGPATVEKEEVQNDQNPNQAWNASATLYCPSHGHTHSTLLDFGIAECPSCGQSLEKVVPQPTPSPSSDGDSDINSDSDAEDVDESEDELHPIPAHLAIDYEVEYRDLGNESIYAEYWGHRFQLERERNRALRKGLKGHKKSVFRVITVLRTNIPSGFRSDYTLDRIRERGFIGNPQMSLAVQYNQIIILSGLFIEALKSVVSYDTQDILDCGDLTIAEPFSIIAHHIEELEDYMRRVDDRTDITNTAGSDSENKVHSVEHETRLHIGIVLSFVNTIIKDPVSQERARHKQAVPLCTYHMMWYLIRPGAVVYVISDEAEDAYVVDSVEMSEFSLSSPGTTVGCSVNLWHLNFDGGRITRARHKVDISQFKGEKPITSLEVVPCEFWDKKKDGGKLRARLEERGRKWVDHLLGKQVDYRGEPFKPGKQTHDGRAYADPASYYELLFFEPEFTPYSESPGSGIGYDNLSIKNVGSFVDDSGRQIGYLLCCRQLKGFVFRARSWETLDIRYCQPVKPDKNPFNRLVMPNERKMMIKALVYKYTDPKYAGNVSQVWGADFIRNKGQGQIFLLHGGPGVGKTFTAECIAEFTGRPLLALTCGDIGTEEVLMERELRYWLKLAYRWGAVMLIDEADVFLEKRQDSDLKRNSLVSVFLREIEYYRGILFLTSNRVGKFDDAIVSRIHVVIHYKGLDDEYRTKIWNQFFDKLEGERGSTIKIDNSARRYVLENKKMAEMKWNGREIRNAFQTAVALAEYRFLTKPEVEKEDGEIAVLEEEDFKEICDMTIKFKEYLKEVNEGQDEETRALLDRARV